MGTNNAPQMSRFLPQVLAATFLVSILPLILVWQLRASGDVTSIVLLIAIGVLTSLAFAWAGRRYWEARSRPLLFGELMIWGFVRRWWTERRLASAARLLGLRKGLDESPGDALSPAMKAKLLEQLAAALEAQDTYTHGHSRRVARYAVMIAKKMGTRPEMVTDVRAAAVVHDVGKIDTPKQILNKPSRLTEQEYAVIKRHPKRGAQMMLERGFDPELAAIVAHHHERIDGKGYPDGLSGDEIPLGARIIAVADTFDALTSERPYRPAMPHKKALAIISEESGEQLDAPAVKAFVSLYSGFRPLAIWALIANVPTRLLYPVLSELQAGAASAAKVAATTAAAVGVAGAVVASDAAKHADSATPEAADGAVAGAVGSGSARRGGDSTRDKTKSGAGKRSGTHGGGSSPIESSVAPSGSGASGGGNGGGSSGGNGNGGGNSGGSSGSNAGGNGNGNGNSGGNGNGGSGDSGGSGGGGGSSGSNAGGNGNGNGNAGGNSGAKTVQ